MADDEGTAHLKRHQTERQAEVADPGYMMRYDKRAGSPLQKSQMRQINDMVDSINKRRYEGND